MKLFLAVFGIAVMPVSFAMAQTPGNMAPAARQTFVNQYCVGCHNDKLKSGGFSWSKIDVAHPEQSAEQIEKVVRKLHAGMMPPAGAPRPAAPQMNSFITSLEADVDAVASAHPNPGRPALHRLNRNEFRNSLKDLFDLDVDVNSMLPADDMSHGFDNMAEVLGVSPTLMEGYVRAASKITRLALGDAAAKPAVETYHVSQSFSQLRHVDGTPMGTRGGIAVMHNFPADGEYTFRMTLYFTTNTFLFGSTGKGEQLEVSVNGHRVGLFDVNPMMKVDDDLRTPPIKVKAGPQLVSASFIRKADGPVDDLMQPWERSLGNIYSGQDPGLTSLPHLRDIGINGPYNATGVSETASRRKVLICKPIAGADELPCAKKIISNLASKAWRGPVSEADMEDLLGAYQKGRNNGDFESGIRLAMQTILAHPEFVYRFERTPGNVAPGGIHRLTDLELASRLSFFLWSTGPDDELMTLATQNKLHEPAIFEKQVRRMMASPKAESLASNFAGEWLYLRNLKDSQPDVYLFPDSDENLLSSMKRETELFFMSMMREDRNVVDLLNANYTFVDERLAKHYGIPDVTGNDFRRVTLKDENRFGLLGKGSTLTVSSFANRTSPVVRGKWVLEQILGVTAPTPPPNVPPLKENAEGSKPVPVRERLEAHRANEPCASCHKIMDPIGFSLENFDAVGSWRTTDNGFKVDSTGKLVDGTPVNGPVSLRNALVAHSDSFILTFTTRMLTYALGRGTEYYDMPVIRAIARDAAKNNNRFSSFVMGIVKSTPFQMRKAEEVSPTNSGVGGGQQ